MHGRNVLGLATCVVPKVKTPRPVRKEGNRAGRGGSLEAKLYTVVGALCSVLLASSARASRAVIC